MTLPELTDLANKPKLSRSHKGDRQKHLRSAEDLFGGSKKKASKDKRGRPWARNPRELAIKTEVDKDDVNHEEDEDSVDENSDSEEDVSLDGEEYELDELDDKDFLSLIKDAPVTEESTKRLAILHFDWDNTKVDDLFILLESFVPKGGQLIKVTIYPSNYGIVKMEEERVSGPSELKSNAQDNQSGSSFNDQVYDLDDKKNWKLIPKKLKLKIRNYQLSRLKYFYAVAEFDSVETANSVYQSCDGFEYQNSGVSLDLRFIPDNEVFDIDEKYKDLVSQCTGINKARYIPKRFVNDALHSTRVEMTWDKTPSYRTQWMRSQFSEDSDPKKTLEEGREELEKYVAFSSSGASTCASSDVDEPGPAPTVPRIRKHRPPKIPIDKARALLFGNQQKKEETSEESEEEEEYDLGDEVEENGSEQSAMDVDDKASSSSKDPFAVFDQDSPIEFEDCEDSEEDEGPSNKKLKNSNNYQVEERTKKVSRRKKIKEKMKQSKETRKGKSNRERELWFNEENLTEDSRFDEMLKNPVFKIEQTHPQYEKAKNFNEFIKIKKEKIK